MCIECAVRISTLRNEPDEIGFGYETLPGHVEKGVSEFYVRQQHRDMFFNIRSRSAPAHWAARIARPLALCYQSWCTRQALLHMERRFLEENGLTSNEEMGS